MAKKGEYKLTPAKQRKFLEHYAALGLINRAARAVGATPQTIRQHRKRSPQFDGLVTEAYADFCEHLEAAVYERAVVGEKRPVFGKDGQIGDEVVKSDRLFELALKRHIPAYSERHRVDMNVSGGVMVVPPMAGSSKEWEHD